MDRFLFERVVKSIMGANENGVNMGNGPVIKLCTSKILPDLVEVWETNNK
ncbi:hypothetical protein GCM10022296_14640 [Secundilactobacillus similis DSM 23365 = JCM 2765]